MKISRRGLLAAMPTALIGTAAVASSAMRLRPWHKGELQIHLIHTGVAESQFFIFPDGTTMLLDCGDHPAITRLELSLPAMPDASRLAGEWVARYVQRVNPNGSSVDYMESSHWHDDHTGSVRWQTSARGWNAEAKAGLGGCFRSGFALAAEFLHFKKAIDRGYPNYDDPIPTPVDDLTPLGHIRRLYAALCKRDGLAVEKIRLGASDQIVPVRGGAECFSVFNLCANGQVVMPDGSRRFVYADLFRDGKKPDGLNENGMSIGHIIRYGKFAYYTAGDFSDLRNDGGAPSIEEVLAMAVGPVNVAKINHHGYYSMPDSLVRALHPQVWTSCIWDRLHLQPVTLSRLRNPANYPDGRSPMIISGCHTVVTVPSNATHYRVDCVSARDESMTVESSREFRIHGV